MNKRITYSISRNRETLATIPARSYQEAAKIYARRIYGRNSTAYQTTGKPGMSGYFRAYERLENGWSSTGDAFHVTEL